jgi:hypothetical protein
MRAACAQINDNSLDSFFLHLLRIVIVSENSLRDFLNAGALADTQFRRGQSVSQLGSGS